MKEEKKRHQKDVVLFIQQNQRIEPEIGYFKPICNILIVDMCFLKQGKAKQTGRQISRAAMITLSPSPFFIICHPKSEDAAPICLKQGCLLSSNYQQMHGAITAQRLYLLLTPCGSVENGTALPVSQLVAMVTHPTSLPRIPASCELAMVAKKKSYKNNMDKKEDRGRKINDDHTQLLIYTLMICCSNKAHVYGLLGNKASLD